MVYVGLECGAFAVTLLLAQFESPCAAEHYVYDSCVPQRCYNPLPWCAIGAKAYDEATAPQKYLSKIVRTTYNAIEPCAHKTSGGSFLCHALLCVGYCFYEESGKCNRCTYPKPRCTGVCFLGQIVKIECNGAYLSHI